MRLCTKTFLQRNLVKLYNLIVKISYQTFVWSAFLMKLMH